MLRFKRPQPLWHGTDVLLSTDIDPHCHSAVINSLETSGRQGFDSLQWQGKSSSPPYQTGSRDHSATCPAAVQVTFPSVDQVMFCLK